MAQIGRREILNGWETQHVIGKATERTFSIVSEEKKIEDVKDSLFMRES